MNGAKKWFFADGYIEKGGIDGKQSHEALCILNATNFEANIRVQFFFTQREPMDFKLKLGALRNIHIRLNDVGIPYETPYGIKVESDVEIVVQLSRMSISKNKYALMTTMGYWEE